MLAYVTSLLALLSTKLWPVSTLLPIDEPLHVPRDAKFPAGFLHGYATAAPQVEGAVDVDGRGPSIWDPWSKVDGHVQDGSTTEIATRSYELWEEDIQLLADLGANAYRFSISWSRVIPLGGKHDPVNPKGLEYYDRLIDGLLARNITPVVTLHHWDVPLALQEKYEAWLSPEEMAEDLVRFADVCFERYGDRVKHWITINEPLTVTGIAYYGTEHPPSYNSTDKALLAGYGILLGHAKVVELYKTKYQPKQLGKIGIALCGTFGIPFSDDPEDVLATKEKWEFNWDWYASPIFLTGDYPDSMKRFFGNRLPKIRKPLSKLLLGSADFFAFNTYFYNAIHREGHDELHANTKEYYHFANGTEFGHPVGGNEWRGAPRRLYDLLLYIHNTYKKPMYITEFGFARRGEPEMGVDDAVQDDERVTYLQQAFDAMRKAVHDGVDLRGAFVWTLADNWEWQNGFTWRFGAAHTDVGASEARACHSDVKQVETAKRTIKDSGLFTRKVAASLVIHWFIAEFTQYFQRHIQP